MNIPAPKSAWLPVTPRGVAAFAQARTGRLLVVQLLVALVAACAIGWFLHQAWAPAIREAINNTPDEACIMSGALSWPTNSPVLLSEGHFLGIAVDLEHSGQITPTSHLKIEFGRRGLQVASLLGVFDPPSWLDTSYPANVRIGLGRTELGPWWGSREPFLILLTMAGAASALLLTWAVLGLIYSGPVWLVGFFANRALDWRGSWRLGSATLLPGALLLSAAILLYGARIFDPLKLGIAFGIHILIGWIYVLVGPLFLERHPDAPPGIRNPFANGK